MAEPTPSAVRPSAARMLRVLPRHGRPIRSHVDDRTAKWERHATASRSLTRARVRLKNARTKIARLEADLAIQREHEAAAAQQVLDLWPKVPASCRCYFNDGLETAMDAGMREAAE